jgi:hypothetical protein
MPVISLCACMCVVTQQRHKKPNSTVWNIKSQIKQVWVIWVHYYWNPQIHYHPQYDRTNWICQKFIPPELVNSVPHSQYTPELMIPCKQPSQIQNQTNQSKPHQTLANCRHRRAVLDLGKGETNSPHDLYFASLRLYQGLAWSGLKCSPATMCSGLGAQHRVLTMWYSGIDHLKNTTEGVIVLCVISLRKVLKMHQNNYFLTLIRGGGMLVDIELSMLQTWGISIRDCHNWRSDWYWNISVTCVFV